VNATEQRECADLLKQHLEGVVSVTRGTRTGGNITGQEDVPWEALVAAWTQRGWWVRKTPPVDTKMYDLFPRGCAK